MRVVLINPPHPSIGSRIPREQLPPLGLLSIGGPLIDDGHAVELVDAEFGPMPLPEVVQRAAARAPQAVLLGHSGSTSGHPIAAELTRLLRVALPRAAIVYGGVFPTYHWREILAEEPQIDVIVRGEGEAIIVGLMRALEADTPLDRIAGIAYRIEGVPTATPPAPVIRDLDAYRVGWELIDIAATATGAASAQSSCSSRVVARTSAIIAASAASGRAGATAIRRSLPPRSPGSTACTASR
jgi:anaerobic magnesium-protoporphyrin IX monomethyl ester cyclase